MRQAQDDNTTRAMKRMIRGSTTPSGSRGHRQTQPANPNRPFALRADITMPSPPYVKPNLYSRRCFGSSAATDSGQSRRGRQGSAQQTEKGEATKISWPYKHLRKRLAMREASLG
jgi:hypothetical protein